MKSTKSMLLDAQARGYAVPAFNVHNLETLQVVTQTANKLKSPVIVAATPSTIAYSNLDYLIAMVNVSNEINDVEITLHLDHHENIEQIKEAILKGVKSVMIDGSHYDFETNVKITKEVVDFAHLHGATVEAELGVLSGIEDDLVVDEKNALYTDPSLAKEFVERTNVDSLAIAIGTAHGLYKNTPVIDIERLKEIHKMVDVPLVLHGASNVPYDIISECISNGICKVNIATDLKMPFADALKQYFIDNPEESDPRKYFKDAKEAMSKIVEEKIKVCMSDGKS